jgi:hypothetical protein
VGSGTGFNEPCEYTWGTKWMKSSGSGLENRDKRLLRSVVLTTRHTSTREILALNSPTRGGCSVGTVRVRTKIHEVQFSLVRWEA